MIKGLGKSWKVKEGQGRSRKVMDGLFPSAPVLVPFLWTLDFGFETRIWDLNLGLRTWTWAWQYVLKVFIIKY